MKLARCNRCRAASASRLALVIAHAVLVPLLIYGSAPSWWSQRGVLVNNATPDDYAPANQGQLKNIANAAVAEMDARLTGGAGDELHNLLTGWAAPASQTNDYAPVNLGQLKNTAKLFYDRLIAARIVDFYPWLRSPNDPDDFAIANIGQVESLFSFEIPAANLLADPFGDRLAAGIDGGSLALEETGVWNWGGPLSAASMFERNYPRRISGLSGVSSVSVGQAHLVVLRSDGSVWTWGENGDGQLGDGTNQSLTLPGAVPNVRDALSVKAGFKHTLVLKRDGTVLAWGGNRYGQLGTGDTLAYSTPQPVIGLNNVRRISARHERSMAIKSDGTLWIWGYEYYAPETGQTISHLIPVLVSALEDVVDATSGLGHLVAVKSDGTVWAWGSNNNNQIGNGNPWWKSQPTPFQVPNLSNIAKVSSNGNHTLALANDGTVWAWGSNSSGQLGDGTSQVRQAPVHVAGLTNVVAIAAANSYSLAMKADGTVWAWGDGAAGTPPGSDLHIPQPVIFGVADTNHNAIDDRWEAAYLGSLNQSGDGDLDGDGISNRQEFLRGTDPRDYFNGATPVIEIVSGNNQMGDPGTLLSKPIVVRVKNASGKVFINAPVDFRVSSGSGFVTVDAGAPLQNAVVRRTDASGLATAFVMLPEESGTSSRIAVSPVMAGSTAAASGVVFREISRFVLPPTPTPVPDPSATPTPSPTASASPAATPPLPYRYAIIDLGKDLYPVRINNKGWILLQGPDANGNWAYYRWKGGTLERLDYSGPHTSFNAVDMNDDGVVVGSFSNDGPWGDQSELETQGGLLWPPDRSTATRISAPESYPGFGPRDWYLKYRQASVTAISNSGDAFGQMCTGSVCGFLYANLFVMNSASWPGGSDSPTQLSHAIGTNDDPNNAFISHWTGSSDTVGRANSAGHYIGGKLTPVPFLYGSFYIYGSQSGMVDGQSVAFQPVDINEAGIVAGSAGADMVVYGSPASQSTIRGASPLAINDHTRPAPSPSASPQASPTPGPSPTPVPVPQILGWAGNALVVWERQPNPAKTWHPFGLEEMIPSMDGWEYLDPRDINDAGAIIGSAWFTDPSNPSAQGENHGFLLVPVEIRDAKEADDPSDDQLIEWQPSVGNPNIRSVAWIEPHKKKRDTDPSSYDAGDDPIMPQLVIQLKGVASPLRLRWRFRCTYHRPSGRFLPEDDLKFPADGSFVELQADRPWELHRTINDEPLFGGDAEVGFVIVAGDGRVMLAEQIAKFRIAGKNPDDDRCRKYIDKATADLLAQSITPMWYAYAVAKSETRDEGGEPFYNQFLAKGIKYPRKKVEGETPISYEKTKWDGGRGKEGLPNWNNDGKFGAHDKDAQGHSLNGLLKPGGYGIKQVTGWHGEESGNVPRSVIWNWKTNVDEGLVELVGKHVDSRDWMDRQRRAATKPLPTLTVNDVTFRDGTGRTMDDAVAIKHYNGSSSRKVKKYGPDPDLEPEPRRFFYTREIPNSGHYCYWDGPRGKWSLSRYNSLNPPFNYVQRVCEEVDP
jgi:hypothetical protein